MVDKWVPPTLDAFNLNAINKNTINLIALIANIPQTCEDFIIDPVEEKGNQILENIIKIEKEMLKVKENVANMVSQITVDSDLENNLE